MHTNYPSSPPQDDEIDLFELFSMLWKEKLLILMVTVTISVIAFAYTLTIAPTYNTTMQLTPAAISNFGSYVANLENKEKLPITLAQESSK